MIRIRPLPLASCDGGFPDPYLHRHGYISVHQMPGLAEILAEDARLLAYEFVAGNERLGFVIVKVRHRILADISFGPVLLDNEQFIPCIKALKPELRRKGLLLLRIFPPPGTPAYRGLPAHFNWATSVVDISRNEEDILKSFSPNHRQSIRKALAAGLQVRALAEQEVAAYAQGHVAMFGRRGIGKDTDATRRLVEELFSYGQEKPGSAFILSAYQGDSNRLIGGGVFLRSGDTCTYYQGYAERLEPPLPVLHLLIWEAMKQAKCLGCKRFDLSGYSLDGHDRQLKAVNDFKRWFRGDIIEYPATVVVPLYPLLGLVMRWSGKRI